MVTKQQNVDEIGGPGEFKSEAAQQLAGRYRITFEGIPELRRLLRDNGVGGLERLVVDGKLSREKAAQALAAEAIFSYEMAARKKGIVLVGIGLSGVVGELFNREIGTGSADSAGANARFAAAYAARAAWYNR